MFHGSPAFPESAVDHCTSFGHWKGSAGAWLGGLEVWEALQRLLRLIMYVYSPAISGHPVIWSIQMQQVLSILCTISCQNMNLASKHLVIMARLSWLGFRSLTFSAQDHQGRAPEIMGIYGGNQKLPNHFSQLFPIKQDFFQRNCPTLWVQRTLLAPWFSPAIPFVDRQFLAVARKCSPTFLWKQLDRRIGGWSTRRVQVHPQQSDMKWVGKDSERFAIHYIIVQLFPLNPSMHTSSMVSLPNACFVWKQWMNTRTPASCEDNKIIMKWLEIPNQPVYCDGINGFLWLLINGSLSWSCGTWWNLMELEEVTKSTSKPTATAPKKDLGMPKGSQMILPVFHGLQWHFTKSQARIPFDQN